MWDRFDDAMDAVTDARIGLVDREREVKTKLRKHGLRVPAYEEPKETEGVGVSWADKALSRERDELSAYRTYVGKLEHLLKTIE